MTDIRRLAQIGVFLLGLSQLPRLLLDGVALIAYQDFTWEMVLISAGHALFVLSLVLASSTWAAVVEPSGTASSMADFRRDDFLRAAVPVLGLYFLLTGVAEVLGAILQWFIVRGSSGFERASVFSFVETPSVVRTVVGAVLLFWGSSVFALVRWAQALGDKRGAV